MRFKHFHLNPCFLPCVKKKLQGLRTPWTWTQQLDRRGRREDGHDDDHDDDDDDGDDDEDDDDDDDDEILVERAREPKCNSKELSTCLTAWYQKLFLPCSKFVCASLWNAMCQQPAGMQMSNVFHGAPWDCK